MDGVSEYKLLSLELRTLLAEAIKRSQIAEAGDYEPRRLFALTQVLGCRDLLQYLIDNDESAFGEVLEATLEDQETQYWEAWKDDNRERMTIALAHRRLLKRLIRRLTDPRRRQMLLPQLNPNL
ncbi:hypothetical protein [Geomonas azotofigens]|uniref:hypothetical protein n=1 Tax=Geomonas azotofigens TaxID=2843196 RepID=UPI001C0F80D1|nr:hypothetical protein [Geomonas azotofigens]MBU5614708.1 hypothetical protein [Geomonas azotofigens]